MHFNCFAVTLALSVAYGARANTDAELPLFSQESSDSSGSHKTPIPPVHCEIPNEEKLGICMEVGNCSAYLQARNITDVSSEKVNFLKKVQCSCKDSGDRIFQPLVCCPANGQDYLYPSLKFSKFEYRRFQNVTAQFKRKKLKRRIQTVEPAQSFNLRNECGKQVTNRIYGGEIAELDEFPWLALLVYNSNDFGCSGALIDDRHVLTAAHCVRGEGVREKRGL
ncbi:serine protease easter-like [Rhagoletis pomonella]|uniref:serine protease easter-like n=1 Tax=Rhagoletis pomonella TaxID=28610 RepID=UPI00177FAB7E|nr:serine protease easter-like [Rhagoletis pomonella]